ncbi:MAG: isopentenyl-diphosphate delta-isomerase [Methanobacteriota archaeon]|jgi:isopentenyl-diphosphate delta-isomerase|uniref:Isopentenyl-diphosphate delta-isomerase n=1 Tax=Halorutilus salinus TaxID=2487751 RepID=A0A9Q4C444_9EURY|nr:type 2 isopentenyl-diphosphate Delta-isomerase [Halorutilus salinus]MCX2817981.1 type 2 isopentenyl-diphosphate Delta-isomerase [Halorutilus salinus]
MPGTSERKDDHIRIVKEEDVEEPGTGFVDVSLVHDALPGTHLDDVDTSTDILGATLGAPVFIESMTGGHPNATKINRNLAYAADEMGVAMGVGSQRAALEDDDRRRSYEVVRDSDAGSDAFVYGNIGAAQLDEYGVEGVEECIDMIDADAMAVHLNFLQEAVQPAGDVDARGCLEEIEHVAREASVPVIVKETGNGISDETARELAEADVDCVDVAGKGGTTWSGVEAYRASAHDDRRGENLGELFRVWGIPTVASTVLASDEHPCVVASGGVRSGLDIAKAVALGASAGGLAKPFLKPGAKGSDEALEAVEQVVAELRTAMFVTGSEDIDELSKARSVVTGRTDEYLQKVR